MACPAGKSKSEPLLLSLWHQLFAGLGGQMSWGGLFCPPMTNSAIFLLLAKCYGCSPMYGSAELLYSLTDILWWVFLWIARKKSWNSCCGNAKQHLKHTHTKPDTCVWENLWQNQFWVKSRASCIGEHFHANHERTAEGGRHLFMLLKTFVKGIKDFQAFVLQLTDLNFMYLSHVRWFLKLSCGSEFHMLIMHHCQSASLNDSRSYFNCQVKNLGAV